MALATRIRTATRRALARSAHDATAIATGSSALVLAPHPDDETLGCGGTILRKLAAGSTVTVAVVTDGSRSHASEAITPSELAALRSAELAEAARRLGLPEAAVRRLGFEDGELTEHEDELTAAISVLIAEIAPDEVYATSAAEPHPDHAAVGRAARRALERSGSFRLLEYPVWLWGVWPLQAGRRLGSLLEAAGRRLRRDAIVVRVDGVAAAKRHALDAHASQLRRPASVPDDEPWNTLPPSVLAAAAEPVELFFPVRVATRSARGAGAAP